MEPVFFRTSAELRRWLAKNHANTPELWVGFYKKGFGEQSLTWQETVDELLCFGWIDGIRRKVDDQRYMNRITPRKPRSNWSDINIRRVEELTAAGRMEPAGLAAFEHRDEAKPGVLRYEDRKSAALTEEQERAFRANAQAWQFFQAQPPGYRQNAIFWVVSARRDETREKRLVTLIDESAAGRRVERM